MTLSNQRDALGMPRVKVDWKLGDDVKHGFDTNFRLFGEALERAGVAKVRLETPLLGREWELDTVRRKGSWHHMGTTRMADSPREGVVDRNAKVHGIANLLLRRKFGVLDGGDQFPDDDVGCLVDPAR